MSRSIRLAVATALAVVGLGAGLTTPASAAPLPSITKVTFAGTAGPAVTSPTITIKGTGFGAAPTGTDNSETTCGTYTSNGRAYGSSFYFVDNNRFLAGYSDSDGAACIGIVVQSWTPQKIVFSFGNSYGSFGKWWLRNGDGFAVSVKNAIYGNRVTALT